MAKKTPAKKTAKKKRAPRKLKPQPLRVTLAEPKISTGNAKKAVADDLIVLALKVCDALEEKGAERGKLGMILTPEVIGDLDLQEGEHFQYSGRSCVSIPHLIHPVELVKLARKLHLLRESVDQEEGTYFPLQVEAWIHLYPELL